MYVQAFIIQLRSSINITNKFSTSALHEFHSKLAMSKFHVQKPNWLLTACHYEFCCHRYFVTLIKCVRSSPVFSGHLKTVLLSKKSVLLGCCHRSLKLPVIIYHFCLICRALRRPTTLDFIDLVLVMSLG